MPTPRPALRPRWRQALALSVVAGLLMAPALALVPRQPYAFKAGIDRMAAYQPQNRCSPSAKKGTVAFANLLLKTYPRSHSLGIVRECSAAGVSEHKEGRAFDWAMNYYNAKDRKQVRQLITWLLKTDKYGNRYAMARRLGVMYIIWNKRIWGAYRASDGWRPYTGSNPHRDHVHFSLSWAGARGNVSFWNKKKRLPTGVVDPTPAGGTSTGGGDTSGSTGDHSFPNPTPDTPTRTPQAIPEPTPPATIEPGAPLTEETVTVGTRRRRGATTAGALVAGRPYLLEVRGTYRYAAPEGSVADAECAAAPASDWRRSRSVRSDNWRADHLDLYIDGHDLYSDADSGQDCDSTHTYRWIYTPTRTGRPALRVWDPTSYKDNAGRLSVHIVDLGDSAQNASWTVPATAATGRTSGVALRGGQTYQVTVTGTWSNGQGVTADAECTSVAGSAGWRRDRFASDIDHYDVVAGRLARSGQVPRRTTINGQPVGGGECDAANHAYTFLWTAEDSMPLNMRVDDPTGHRDNTGSLRVSVAPYTGPAQPPTTTGGSPETLDVDATVSSETLSGSWPAGTPVRITVSGTYRMRDAADWTVADAECTSAWNDMRWLGQRRDGWVNGQYVPLGDLMVNGHLLTWTPTSGSGTCDPNHVYVLNATTYRDGPLRFSIADDDFADNAGSLRVRIERR